jgi:hypothetical protein
MLSANIDQMKTARCLLLVIGLVAWTQRESFAETPAQATPRAASQSVAPAAGHAASGRHGSESEQEAKGTDTTPPGEKVTEHQDNVKGTEHSAAVPDESRVAGKHTLRGNNTRRPGSPSLATSQIHGPGGTSFVHAPNRMATGNIANQNHSGLSKPTGGVNNAPSAKKSPGFSARPVAPLTAGKLPTAPLASAAHGRISGLATIGGPAATSKVGNTAAINGTATRRRY